LHELPWPLQVVTDDLHLLLTGSQMFEQHWPLLVQGSSATLQTTPVPPEPGVPTSPEESRLASPVARPGVLLEQALKVTPPRSIATTARNERALEATMSSLHCIRFGVS
jgi:hypothetical protein